ncbi:TPA: acetyl-CoA C-acyltransferase [Pseudomonas aeruginosa]|uniref:acetyl-CoA C-acyltransferase n=1 Tax=Pseudomonas TaxID=286 RepID=UPI0002A2FF92|nr:MULTISPECIES: acetyl-CoA C-acyltransferase [Pseudomonas]MBB1606254.1 acetyl-CoA acetyltransferase [Pseudomonas sp. UMC76]MBB1611698.1 acetyl-CoA acetyltransferase [Pseudomonas sp. UMC65]MBB1621833.1 acetyl-CoA acetyltransferase [Pseudomonas sp. UME65]MBB1640972.1 acetyl-CoA acetyltransferase [Pseudomonas sp. UME83]NTX90037.1 acetyl-CoA C-acyltransferase [Pseudomonas sp. UMA643]
MNDPVVIVSAVRTPLGAFQGMLASLNCTDLGGIVLREAVRRGGLSGERVDEVLLGCVLPAGLGQSPARQASLKAGLPLSVTCGQVSKVCGSGMKAVMIAHDMLLAGSNRIMLAGGMESMSNAPYLLPKVRGGMRMGHGQVIDHMFFDGLEDAYDDSTRGRLMGTFAEECADAYGFTREEQDGFARQSLERARAAAERGEFAWEVAAVQVPQRGTVAHVAEDEPPQKGDPDKIGRLKPAFRKDGTVTAANSSSIADGAAALLLMRASTAAELGLQPLAVVRGHAGYAQQPALFTTAPVGAMRKLLGQVGWSAQEVDLYEINEAFAVVTLAAMRELDLPAGKVNVNGGACALGHPIGASGARILVTLLGALRARGLRKGVASLCIGGGEATAIALELC